MRVSGELSVEQLNALIGQGVALPRDGNTGQTYFHFRERRFIPPSPGNFIPKYQPAYSRRCN